MRCPFSGGSVFVRSLFASSKVCAWAFSPTLRSGRPQHPVEPLVHGKKKNASSCMKSQGRNLWCLRKPGSAFSHFFAATLPPGWQFALWQSHILKQRFPAPREPGHTRDVTDWLVTWKDIKWKDLASGGGLSKELVGGKTKSFPIPMLSVLLFLRGRNWSERST